MGGESDVLSREEAASLLGWWLDAGVDTPVAEQPRNWLAPPSRAAPTAPPPPAAPTNVPADLDAFHSWLREGSDLPLFRSGAARALPHGPAQAELMLIAGPPDREDAADGRPIGGTAWSLATRMLGAIGLQPEQAYVASLTCFPATTRLSPDEARRCAEQMTRHIALVAPKRLLLLGDTPAKVLLNMSVAAGRGKVHRIDGVPTVVTFHPRHLLNRPGDKALAWRDLLLLMGEAIS
jgi:DNA polymerase